VCVCVCVQLSTVDSDNMVVGWWSVVCSQAGLVVPLLSHEQLTLLADFISWTVMTDEWVF
jgi:hypothetical protein